MNGHFPADKVFRVERLCEGSGLCPVPFFPHPELPHTHTWDFVAGERPTGEWLKMHLDEYGQVRSP